MQQIIRLVSRVNIILQMSDDLNDVTEWVEKPQGKLKIVKVVSWNISWNEINDERLLGYKVSDKSSVVCNQ